MEIDITRLKSGIDSFIPIDMTYSFTKEELENSGILKLDNVKIKGEIGKNSLYDYTINIIVEGTMILPCAISLKPVNYDFSVEIDENLAEMAEEFAENVKNNQKTIDIFPIIWENILMEIPMRIVSDDVSDVKTKGDGWELITDETSGNSTLAKLKDLL